MCLLLKNMEIKKIITIALFCLNIQFSNAQLLKNVGIKLLDKALSEGIDAALKNTSLTIGGTTFAFQSAIENGDVKYKINQGGKEFISVYKDIYLQDRAGSSLKGSDYSFGYFRLNDTAIVISHLIERQPYNADYPNGAKFSLFLIVDSVIYLNEIDNIDTFKAISKNMKKDEGFKPFARFSCGKIYDLTANQKSNNSPIGTYKYYDPFKAIFIYTAIYYKFTYGIIDEQLLTERLQDITNRRAEWLASEKECDHCNKKFTGSAVKIKSNKICSTEI